MITGASGSGKTSTLRAIEQELSSKLVSINYFDEIGVPSFEEMIKNYGSPEKWQERTTHSWMTKLAKISDKKLIFLEGSFNPEFALDILKKLGVKTYMLFCLCTDRKVREQRLIKKRNQENLATQEMENFAQLLKEKTINLNGTIIPSEESPSQIAKKILDCILTL